MKRLYPCLAFVALTACSPTTNPAGSNQTGAKPGSSTSVTNISSNQTHPSNQSNMNLDNGNEDTGLRQELIALLKTEVAGLEESAPASKLTQEHARQIALDPKATDFKVQAVYNPIAPGTLQTRLLKSGVYSSDNLVNAYLSDGSPEEVKTRFKKQLEGVIGPVPFSHYGLSVVRKGPSWYVSLILLTQIVQLEGLPLEIPQPGSRSVTGEIRLAGFNRPHLLITKPDGQVSELTIQSSGNQFSANLSLDQKGLYSFEVNVVGPLGPLPASNFIVAVGVPYPQPRESDEKTEQVTDLAKARQTLLNLVNQDRQSLGFKPLSLDERLSQASQAHCEDMVQNHFIGHNSPTQGTPQQQAARFNVSDLVAQNLAISRSLANSQHELMSSPGHRKTILTPEHTHVGFGISRGDDGFLYITQLFTQRQLELGPLPSSQAKNKQLSVTGKSTQDGFVAVFVGESIQGEPLKVKKGESFALPVNFSQTGKQRLRIGYAEPPKDNLFNFIFYNIWDLEVSS